MKFRLVILALLAAGVGGLAQAQGTDSAARLEDTYRVVPNITYVTASNYEAKLDLYVRRAAAVPQPTVIFFHGGGWTGGTKEGRAFAIQPYLAMGLDVVNVEYRLARVALAPAAVEDCRCALRWVIAHAKEYGIDPQKLVVAGDSAGGHLALATAFLPASAGLDRECPGADDLKVAAVLNWYGISDVNELLDGPNMRAYAVAWLGSLPNREDVARRVSPLTYVRPGLPPVLTIHGDADPTVPYTQALRLQKALTAAGVVNELLTMPGGKHGLDCCNVEQRTKVYQSIQTFLRKHGVLPPATTSSQP